MLVSKPVSMHHPLGITSLRFPTPVVGTRLCKNSAFTWSSLLAWPEADSSSLTWSAFSPQRGNAGLLNVTFRAFLFLLLQALVVLGRKATLEPLIVGRVNAAHQTVAGALEHSSQYTYCASYTEQEDVRSVAKANAKKLRNT